MPNWYWPKSVAAESASSGMVWRRPRTLEVSTRVMMLMAELLSVMGTPMARTWRMMAPLLSGVSRDGVRSRWVARYAIRKSMESMVPTVTPKMAPAAPMSRPMPILSRYQARGSPMHTLHNASRTWEMAVGVILPWPWV